MRHCLACNACYGVPLVECPVCGATIPVVDGFDAFAPEFAHEGGGGFKADYFATLAAQEEQHFWFRVRNKLILWAIRKYINDFDSFLEIGCGTGFVLRGVSQEFPGRRIVGSEIFTTGLGFASARLPKAHLMQMDACRIPFIDEFDVIGAFDVLEHIKDDETALAQIYKALKPGGVFLLTVPQHAWLWSPVDDYAFHKRRYSENDLVCKLERCGFEILRSTSFVTTLLPAMMLSRTLQRRKSGASDGASEFKIGALMNFIFESLLNLDFAGIRLGMNFPVGGSRLVVARKNRYSVEAPGT